MLLNLNHSCLSYLSYLLYLAIRSSVFWEFTHVRIFSEGPLSSANKACFSLWFSLSAAELWQPAANMQKKRSCELAKYSASREEREKKKEETWVRGRQSVCTPPHNVHQAQRDASQQTTTAMWAEWRLHHNKPKAEPFISGTFFLTNTRAHQVYHL